MGIIDLINIFKKASLFLLKCQERLLVLRLGRFVDKNKKHLGKSTTGCSITFSSKENENKEVFNSEIKEILKERKNDFNSIVEYISFNGTKVLKIQDAKKVLSVIDEEPGLIIEHSGFVALFINFVFFHKISFKSEPMFIIDEKSDIYNLIQQFHKWYFMKKGYLGFDEKTQKLLRQVNEGDNSVMDDLDMDEMTSLRQAIARDVESIDFVVQYARETDGSKQALNKIKNDGGTNI